MNNFLGITALSTQQLPIMDLVISQMKAQVFHPPHKINTLQIDSFTFRQLIISNFIQYALWSCHVGERPLMRERPRHRKSFETFRKRVSPVNTMFSKNNVLLLKNVKLTSNEHLLRASKIEMTILVAYSRYLMQSACSTQVITFTTNGTSHSVRKIRGSNPT